MIKRESRLIDKSQTLSMALIEPSWNWPATNTGIGGRQKICMERLGAPLRLIMSVHQISVLLVVTMPSALVNGLGLTPSLHGSTMLRIGLLVRFSTTTLLFLTASSTSRRTMVCHNVFGTEQLELSAISGTRMAQSKPRVGD